VYGRTQKSRAGAGPPACAARRGMRRLRRVGECRKGAAPGAHLPWPLRPAHAQPAAPPALHPSTNVSRALCTSFFPPLRMLALPHEMDVPDSSARTGGVAVPGPVLLAARRVCHCAMAAPIALRSRRTRVSCRRHTTHASLAPTPPVSPRRVTAALERMNEADRCDIIAADCVWLGHIAGGGQQAQGLRRRPLQGEC
jgi:hypothetical protein